MAAPPARIVLGAATFITQRFVRFLDPVEVPGVGTSRRIRMVRLCPFPVGMSDLRRGCVRRQSERVIVASWIDLRSHTPTFLSRAPAGQYITAKF
jgi:hypothetical protein